MSADVAVVGGGINGLCAAWRLRKRGMSVALFDRFPAGHGRGSSHGEERIIRSSYGDAATVRAMLEVRAGLWPALERDVGVPLIHPGPAVFWGPEEGPLPAYAAAVREAGADVEEIGAQEARRRFPHMCFPDAERVLHDHHAGVIAAGRTVRGLERWLRVNGVERREATVLGLEEDDGGVDLLLAGERVRAGRVIVTAGPWASRLVPVAERARPARQHVGFWEMGVSVGRTPAWVHLGVEGLHYGLPTLDGRMKAAFHGTGDGSDDPSAEVAPDPRELASVEARLGEWFAPGPGRRVGADTCFYTNADEDALILAPPPGYRRVLAVTACSGHAFKLAPLTGERAAQWC